MATRPSGQCGELRGDAAGPQRGAGRGRCVDHSVDGLGESHVGRDRRSPADVARARVVSSRGTANARSSHPGSTGCGCARQVWS